LINFFSNWPELFTDGRIYKLDTPLYIARKGKQVKYFYTAEEYTASDLDKSWTVDYCKGLGSLEKADYKEAINNPKLRCISLAEAEDAEKLEMAFGDDADRRKTWMTT